MKTKDLKDSSVSKGKIKALEDEDLLNVSGGVLQQNININQMWVDGDNCPRCRSSNTEIDFAEMEHVCLNCGYRWT